MLANPVAFEHSWQEVKLGSVAQVDVGGTPSTAISTYWGGDIPWMTSGDVHQRRITDVPGRITLPGLLSSNAKIIPPPAVAIALAGQGKTRGTVALIMVPLCTNQSVALVRGHDATLDTSFLFHVLNARYEELRARSAGGGRAGLSKAIIEAIPILLPSVAEQGRIANILDTVDLAIQQTEVLIFKLKQAKAGLLHDLLTRGIDKHGHLRDPEAHPEQFKNSSIGCIPIKWEESSVRSELDLVTGFTINETRRPRKNARRYLRVANVQRERVLLDDVAELEATDTEVKKRLLEQDDLLIVEGHANPDEIGRCALVPRDAIGFTFQNHLFRLRAKRMNALFALAWLNSEWVRAYWRRLCGTSSGLNTINSTMLNNLAVMVPGDVEQERIVAMLITHDARICAEEAYHNKLKLQKQGLMDDLLTGRVRVTALERTVAG